LSCGVPFALNDATIPLAVRLLANVTAVYWADSSGRRNAR
jgi:hypothetical protein